MGIGTIDNEYGVREGWVRDEDNEIGIDGYNAFIQITTNDGTSGFSVKDSAGADVFRAKSDGYSYIAKRLGVGIDSPQVELEVVGKTRTDQLQIPTGAVSGYVLKSDSNGNVSWGMPEAGGGDGYGREVGFENTTDSIISFDDINRRFTITPSGTHFVYYINGTPYTKTETETVDIDNVEGLHFIYYNGSSLLSTTSFSDDLLLSFATVSIIYWDATNLKHIYFADERHGVIMSAETHLHLHLTQGTQYISGLALSNIIADGNGNSNSHAQFSVEDGVIRDEDLRFDITDDDPQNLSFPAEIPILYKYGASGNWRLKTADTFPVIYSGTAGYTGTRLPYNQYTGSTWQLTEATNNNFVLVHYFATNDIEHPITGIQGQNVYLDISSARQGASQEINNIVTSGLPLAEITPIGTVLFQTSNTYSNTPKARIRLTDTGNNYEDFRDFKYSSTGGPGSHSNLSNLGYDESGHHGFQRKTFEASGVPAADHDGYNSSGIGVIFQEGDFWINLTTDKVYVCKDNSLNAADWDLVLTPQEHSEIDQLVHNVAESSFEEYTYSGSKVNSIIIWTDVGKTTKIREEQFTYSGSFVSQIVTIQYDENGVEVERITETYTYSGSFLTNISRTFT